MPRLGFGLGLGEVVGRINLGRGFRVGQFFARTTGLASTSFYSNVVTSTRVINPTGGPGRYVSVVLQQDKDYYIDGSDVYLIQDGFAQNNINIVNAFNRSNITTLNFEWLSSIEATDPNSRNLGIYISNCEQLQEVTLPNVTRGDISIFGTPKLTSIKVNVDSYQNFTRDIIVEDAPLVIDNTKFNIIDFALKTYYNSLTAYNGWIEFVIPGRRSRFSDAYFPSVYKHLYLIPTFYELDGFNPSLSSPTEYIPCTPECSAYTVLAPISSRLGSGIFSYNINRQTTDPVAWHRGLTAEFIKNGNIVNGRDVFSNSSDYHLLFNRQLSGWTIVGPTSSSETVWLSAREGVEYWGNPPSIGWTGRAYSLPGWNYNPSQYGTVWFQETTVLPSSQLLFKGRSFAGEYSGAQLRMYLNPLSGYNPSFYRPELDFSGIVFAPGGPPSTSAKGYMVSPLHYVTNTHFPVPGSAGASVSLYTRNGTMLTRTVLSSVAVGNDVTVGILNTPITEATFYQVGSGTPLGDHIVSREDFGKFLYGPTQDGRVGNGFPGSSMKGTNPSSSGFTLAYPFWHTAYSVPKMNWYGTGIVGGDSTSAMWYTPGGRQILLGSTQLSNTNGPFFGTFGIAINQAMTNLSNRFGLAVHTLSAYNF